MDNDFYTLLKEYVENSMKQLKSEAEEAGIFTNPSDKGSEREKIYLSFLERHLPKQCNASLGGYIFNCKGQMSKQIDIIVTSGNTPQFKISKENNKSVAPVEGTIGAIEIKSTLSNKELDDTLHKMSSIPPINKENIFFAQEASRKFIDDCPFKVLVSFNKGVNHSTLLNHVCKFYEKNQDIPLNRRIDLIHVLGEYTIYRLPNQSSFSTFTGFQETTNMKNSKMVKTWKGLEKDLADTSGMLITILILQKYSFLSNHVFSNCTEWIFGIVQEVANLQKRYYIVK